MKITIIRNKSAGKNNDLSDYEKISTMFQKYNITSEIIDSTGPEIKDKIYAALERGSEVIGISGGDGTISSAVQILADKKIPLAVIPSGTLNHFAKDLGIPLSEEEAVKIIAQMNIKEIDVAEVNGRYFVNNSSVGLYPKVVKIRDREIKRKGAAKWIAMGRAIISVFKKFPLINVRIKSDDSKIYCSTPFLFIGNNEYHTDIFNPGFRETLTGGKLSLFYPVWAGRFTLIRFAFFALLNRLKEQKDFSTIYTDELKIESDRGELEVAVDGEVTHMKTPLNYKIHPLSLSVIVPGETE